MAPVPLHTAAEWSFPSGFGVLLKSRPETTPFVFTSFGAQDGAGCCVPSGFSTGFADQVEHDEDGSFWLMPSWGLPLAPKTSSAAGVTATREPMSCPARRRGTASAPGWTASRPAAGGLVGARRRSSAWYPSAITVCRIRRVALLDLVGPSPSVSTFVVWWSSVTWPLNVTSRLVPTSPVMSPSPAARSLDELSLLESLEPQPARATAAATSAAGASRTWIGRAQRALRGTDGSGRSP